MCLRAWPPPVIKSSGASGRDLARWSDRFLKVVPATLQVRSIRQANQHVVMEGLGAANTAYTVEASADLSPDSFTTVGPAASNAAGIIRFEDNDSAQFSRRFYRFSSP